MALETSYTSRPAGSPTQQGVTAPADEGGEYWPLQKLRRCYTDYLFSKRQEIDEQIEARRYYHGSQWTTEQINVMKKRKQPVMTFNRISRKIDGVIGLVEKLRQDPKAFARTPQHEQGADLATAALRYVLDEQSWKEKSPIVAADGAVDGIGGLELNLTQGDKGDPEIGLEVVDIQSFFYDPRSYKDNFSDARYLGVGKWVDDDIAKEMFPDADTSALSGNDFELVNNSDRQMRWFSQEGVKKRVRMVDIWYRHKGGWCWAIFSGMAVLGEGKSYIKDEKGKDLSKYIMFSGGVDQDGDRYGFIRNMKSAQDGINARQSKMQHILASRRLIISQGAVDDVEKTRTEWARPDGVVVTSRPVNEGVKSDDQSFDFAGWTKMLELNLAEIENFGPNPALIGQGLENQSGRAIALLQQAGMAELGPYILAYRGWKVRVYRAIWNAVQQHWTGERWVRVTDDQNLAQYVQINKLEVDPMTGQPTIVNAVGSLDVDIILDEGPDHVNSMADVYETLSNVLPSIAPLLNPVQAQNVIGVLMETSPLPADVKKRFKDQTEQAAQQPPPPDPAIEMAKVKQQIDMESAQHKMQLDQAKAQGDLQIKQVSAQADMEVQQRSSAADIEAMQIKNQAQIELEIAKARIAAELEREKASIQAGIKMQESEMRCNEMKVKGEHEVSLETAKVKPQTDNLKEFKALADNFEAGMREIAKAMAAPKSIKVQRDGSGKVTGATAVQANG